MPTPRQTLNGPQGGSLASAPQVTPVQSNQGQQIAALGDSLVTTGVQSFKLSREMQRDHDNAKYQEASARYSELLANTEAQFNQLVGEDAHKNFDKMREQLVAKRSQLERNLTSNEQRRAFGLDATSRQTTTLNRMNARRAEQIRVHRIGAASASLDQAMRDRINAVVVGDSTDYIRQSMVMHRKIEQLAELNNLTPEQKKLAIETAESSVSAAAVEGLIDIGAVARADDFLNSIDGRIQDPVKRTKLQQRIRTAGIKQQADALLPSVRQHAQGDMLQQRTFIASMDVPVEVKDELMRRAKIAIAEDRAELSYQRSELLGQATELGLRGEELPEKLETQLKDAGILEQARRAMSGITTVQGEYLMETLTDGQLRMFDNPQSLIAAYAHELSVADRRRLRAKWDATMDEKLRLELAASEQKGGARGRQSTYNDAGPNSASLIKQEDAIDEKLNDLYPHWRNKDRRYLSTEDVQKRVRIRNEVSRLESSMARSLGLKDVTNEIRDDAVRQVLRTQTDNGYAAAGLTPEQLASSTLSIKFGDETVPFNVSRVGLPGAHPDASAKKRFTDSRAELIKERIPIVLNQLPGIGEERAAQIAGGLVTTSDVYRDLARQERNAAVQAGEAAALLDAGKPLPPELAGQVGPKQVERANAHSSVRTMWSEGLSRQLSKPDVDYARDDEAFIQFWPQFERTFGQQLRTAYGDNFSPDEETFRKEVIDLLFNDSSSTQRTRLWRMSGSYTPAAGSKAVEGYHLPGYLSTTPEAMQFSHDLNGRKK